ncbi:hypothetical protein KDW98_31110 [Burkholderia vietnamiensis]|uniref:hypothetical protein n=1 Tax=Burkholderia vietnamiensis TaxID=60552 RepID=UPI001B926415|nr:hypothetical protein [Burkholderia vietnamiensis]MBR8165589.1 hypothetical protein [Burkholderia vietnamiensis]
MDNVSFEQFVCDKCGHQTDKRPSTPEALAAWNTERAEIVDGGGTESFFVTTTKNTSQSQRDTLEEIIRNLAPLVGADTVHRRTGSRGGVFYQVQAKGFGAYESASNTILSLSRALRKVRA